jgi:hypothetical protein
MLEKEDAPGHGVKAILCYVTIPNYVIECDLVPCSLLG